MAQSKSVLYQNVTTFPILGTSPQCLISSILLFTVAFLLLLPKVIYSWVLKTKSLEVIYSLQETKRFEQALFQNIYAHLFQKNFKLKKKRNSFQVCLKEDPKGDPEEDPKRIQKGIQEGIEKGIQRV